jgi:hypothetical protein
VKHLQLKILRAGLPLQGFPYSYRWSSAGKKRGMVCLHLVSAIEDGVCHLNMSQLVTDLKLKIVAARLPKQDFSYAVPWPRRLRVPSREGKENGIRKTLYLPKDPGIYSI